MTATSTSHELNALAAILDEQAGRYRELNGARHLGEYLDRARTREDEELLTEPVLANFIESVLAFPPDAYFPQLGRSGLKPDFTPIDLVAHRFVLDAKSSTQDLRTHERQIRAYIDQRHLDYGVLFNLRELRVYRRDAMGHDPSLSFDVRRLWQVAHGEALDIPLAAIVVFLVWLWISNIAVLLGAEFNAELERGRRIEAGHPADEEPFVEPRDTRKMKD
jgi:hypothetical protein